MGKRKSSSGKLERFRETNQTIGWATNHVLKEGEEKGHFHSQKPLSRGRGGKEGPSREFLMQNRGAKKLNVFDFFVTN